MRNIKLIIEYDGANYRGWQVQPTGATIQGMIEEKLALLTKEAVHLLAPEGRMQASMPSDR